MPQENWEIYQYSDQMLKHMPTNALKTIQKTNLFNKIPVYFANASYERRNHNAAGVSLTGLNATQQTATKKQHAKDLNINDRI